MGKKPQTDTRAHPNKCLSGPSEGQGPWGGHQHGWISCPAYSAQVFKWVWAVSILLNALFGPGRTNGQTDTYTQGKTYTSSPGAVTNGALSLSAALASTVQGAKNTGPLSTASLISVNSVAWWDFSKSTVVHAKIGQMNITTTPFRALYHSFGKTWYRLYSLCTKFNSSSFSHF